MAKIKVKETGEMLDLWDFAELLNKESKEVLLCPSEIQGIFRNIYQDEYAIIDEDGNCVLIDKEKYSVLHAKNYHI